MSQTLPWVEAKNSLVNVLPVLDRLSNMPIAPNPEETLFRIEPEAIRGSVVKLHDHIQRVAASTDHPEQFLTKAFGGIIDQDELNPDHPFVDFFSHFGHRTTANSFGAVAHLADTVFQTVGAVHADLKKTVEAWRNTGRESLIRTVEQVGLYVNVLEANIEGFTARRTRESKFGHKSDQLIAK